MNFRFYTWAIMLWAVLPACNPDKADLAQIDTWIENGNYVPALQACSTALQINYSDTTQYQRIQTRIRQIRHGLFFEQINSLAAQQNWKQAGCEWERLKLALADSGKSARTYFFELYRLKSKIDSAHTDTTGYWTYLEKALEWPTRQRAGKRYVLEQVGLHWAGQDSLRLARVYFDRSFRMQPYNRIPERFKKAYRQYVEGRYDSCFVQLNRIPAGEKNPNWQRLEKLVDLLRRLQADPTRFKLW